MLLSAVARPVERLQDAEPEADRYTLWLDRSDRPETVDLEKDRLGTDHV